MHIPAERAALQPAHDRAAPGPRVHCGRCSGAVQLHRAMHREVQAHTAAPSCCSATPHPVARPRATAAPATATATWTAHADARSLLSRSPSPSPSPRCTYSTRSPTCAPSTAAHTKRSSTQAAAAATAHVKTAPHTPPPPAAGSWTKRGSVCWAARAFAATAAAQSSFGREWASRAASGSAASACATYSPTVSSRRSSVHPVPLCA